jgi:hypothetical protein
VRPQERAGLRLPTAEPVRIDDEKVRGYLLSPTHPVGRFKARVFARLGFEEHLRKYTVPGELRGPAGSTRVLTVWIQEPGQVGIRLVTVRPRWP